MFRVIGFALVVGIAASVISDGNQTVIAIAMLATVAAIVWALMSGRARLTCPYCFKRVKIGASVCHHCGRQVTEPRPIGTPRNQAQAYSPPAYSPPMQGQFDPRQIDRACPACNATMLADAATCPSCGVASRPWILHEGTWWDQPMPGAWMRLDPVTQRWHPVEQ